MLPTAVSRAAFTGVSEVAIHVADVALQGSLVLPRSYLPAQARTMASTVVSNVQKVIDKVVMTPKKVERRTDDK